MSWLTYKVFYINGSIINTMNLIENIMALRFEQNFELQQQPVETWRDNKRYKGEV